MPARDGAALVLCCEVLEHVADPVRALAVLARLARPHLIVSVPREPLWRALNLARGRYWPALGNTPGHLQHWSTPGFLALLQEHLEVVELHTPLPWTMALCRVRERGACHGRSPRGSAAGWWSGGRSRSVAEAVAG